eukprot:TRINITY_DN1540_c0_g1_i1.p1 TRINITY_DN1540_c0_g1~~TRINITY_DN1540_c0_g1_i1.p1  ORF type:complete len:303 (+),score=54.17 TRINITY_DN1540_c0_g1_i1:172-1080(+)
MVLTSFRMVLMSAPQTSIGKWKSINLALPLIYDDKFEKPIFAHDKLKGKCKGVQEELGTILTFKISFTQGNIVPFEFVYKNMIAHIRNQQYMSKINESFYRSLETGEYQRTILDQTNNDPNYSTFLIQPDPYPGANPLTELMEKMLPGLTRLEREKALVQPEVVELPFAQAIPGMPMVADGYAATLQDILPLPAEGNLYPELPLASNALADGYEFALFSKGAAPAFSDELYCGICGAQFSGSNSVPLSCGHSIHKECFEKEIANCLSMNKGLNGINCFQCGRIVECKQDLEKASICVVLEFK